MRPHCLPVFLFCMSLYTATVYSQIPFYTDDADTTPKRQFHLEMYNEHDVLQKSAYPVKRQNTLVFTLNYGLTDKLELGVNAPYITLINSRIVESGAVSGQGAGLHLRHRGGLGTEARLLGRGLESQGGS